MKSLKNALITIRRGPYQSLLAIFMISITFFVGYVFSLTLLGAEEILNFFETRPQVIAFFELEAEESTASQLAEEMKQKSYVESVTLVTREEALKLYSEDNKESPLLLELVTADILPASIEVSADNVESLSQIKQDLENATGVEEVIFREDIVSLLTKWTSSVRLLGLSSTVVLGVTSFLMIMVLISMKVVTKKTPIRIMKIIGATNWYVAAPFIFEGIIYGLVGSLLGWGGMFALLLYLTPWLTEFLGDIIQLPIAWEVFAWQIGIGTVAGIVLGGLASSVAVGRMVKR